MSEIGIHGFAAGNDQNEYSQDQNRLMQSSLRQENERLKQLVADLSVANMLLKKSQS